jgi:hypothetical protein
MGDGAKQLGAGPGRDEAAAAAGARSDRSAYGKTTLLAAWHEAEAARKPMAWLTLDEGDDDPVVLWT